MKKSLFYIFILTVFIGACSEAEQTNPLIIPSCDDGILNQDEEAIDCGGRCIDCVLPPPPIVSPCAASLKKNVFTLDEREFVLTAADYHCSQQSSAYEISVLNNADGITLELGGTIPTEDKVYIYPVHQWFEPGAAQITAHVYGNYYIAGYGEVYVTVKSGKITAEFCSIRLNYNFNAEYYVRTSGKIVCE